MLEGFFVPYTLLVEDENLLGLHVTEYHLLIEHISGPHQHIGDGFHRDFLKIFNVNEMSLNLAEQESLVENNLLSMRNEFCVPSEVSLLGPSSRDEEEGYQRWQEHLGVPHKQVSGP